MASVPVRRDLWIGIAVVVLVTVYAAAWDHVDRSPVHDDGLSLYGLAVSLVPLVRGDAAAYLPSAGTPYPPLVPFVAALHMVGSGDLGLEVARASFWVWYALLAGALYGAVRAEAGALAGAAAGVLGPVLWYASGLRSGFYAELALGALAVAALGALAASRELSRPGWALVAGLALGLGMLVKWSFAFFLAAPTAFVLVVGLVRAGRGPRGGLLAVVVLGAAASFGAWLLGRSTVGWAPTALSVIVAIAGVLALAGGPRWWRFPDGRTRLLGLGLLVLGTTIALPWYLAARPLLTTFLAKNLALVYDGDNVAASEAWPFYPGMALAVLGLPIAALAVVGTLRTALPGRSRLAVLTALAMVGGLVALGAAPYRAIRYAAPLWALLPPLVLVLGAGPARPLAALRVGLLFVGVVGNITWFFPMYQRELGGRDSVDGVAGNTRAGIEYARGLFTDPPVYLPVRSHLPFRDPPDVERMYAEMRKRVPTGPLDVLAATRGGELAFPLRAAELGAVGTDTGVRIRSVGPFARPEDATRALAGLGAGALPANLFVLEVEEQTPSGWASESSPAADVLEGAGLALLWEREVRMRPPRRERVWGRP